MILVNNVEVLGWEHAIRGMRNPLNSWDKSDSFECDGEGCYYESCPKWYQSPESCGYCENEERLDFIIGANDLDLMKRLRNAGTDHAKYKRMITVYADILAPLYWWKEYDTYKVGTVANSCSTMHKIQAKEFTLDDFSHENLDGYSESSLLTTINVINRNRDLFNETKDKAYWWQMIQLLPSSYNQKRTVQVNYEVLSHMYHSRKSHKLDEWRNFCKWIETLPYAKELITGER